MGKRNRIPGQFSARLIEMLESPAYRVLSLSARRVIERVEIEHAHHGGKENGRLPVTFDHFHEYGMHRHAIAPAIREAVALGFLRITIPGRAGNAEHRTPNYFRLTFIPAKGEYGKDGNGCTNEWRSIESIEIAEAIAVAARKTKSQCRKTPTFSDGNRHRKPNSPVPETITTGHGSETITTSISRVGFAAADETAQRAPSQGGAQAGGGDVISLGDAVARFAGRGAA